MYVAIVVGAVIALFVIGLISFVIQKKKLNSKISFVREFKEQFITYWNSGGNNHEVYGWLIHRSNKMQNQMGSQGIISSFKPPYANYYLNNYAIILNMLPTLNESLKEFLLREQAAQYARAIDEALIRHWGSLSDRDEFLWSRLKNPMYWFQQGIRQVTGIPFYILGVFGIMSVGTVTSIVGSTLFGVLSGLITLVGFASAVLSLVVGWDDFLVKIQQLF
ncbi:hypothetical protein [Vibrio fluvialis]|uniref:hypothetical protein n=1 Tax=Vibrio fluvialis TaxID=676 RepID=UPI001EEBCDBF|nr:hypothetical protein [Vibrio fluvialis]MCG6368728.1 hypothetical protein [Vibrio fluvialis]MCG6377429.1 hypothetical protein [Vibrio fluvialis]